MQNLISILYLCMFAISCDQCDCEYVTYENGIEIGRQYWNQDCEDQILSSYTYYNFDGQLIQVKTAIECDKNIFQIFFP